MGAYRVTGSPKVGMMISLSSDCQEILNSVSLREKTPTTKKPIIFL